MLAPLSPVTSLSNYLEVCIMSEATEFRVHRWVKAQEPTFPSQYTLSAQFPPKMLKLQLHLFSINILSCNDLQNLP